MWKHICDYMIIQQEIKNKELCQQNEVNYNPELYKYCLYSLEKNKSFHFNFLMNNIFMSNIQTGLIIDMYVKVTTMFHRIRRCIFNYWVKGQKACNTVDLSYTPFSEYKKDQYFYMLDGRRKYIFTHTEMYNIIETSLTNADSNLIANPLSIKNPYTGTQFSRSKLYHIYFTLKHTPPFFKQFMMVNFDLHIFLLEQECSLRQYSIHKKIKNFTSTEIKDELRYMVVDMYSLILHSTQDTDIILNCKWSMSRELLTHYYNYTYSLSPYQRLCECKTLVTKINNMSKQIHKNIQT